MENALKKAKRKLTLKVVIISVITAIVVVAGGYYAISRLTNHQSAALFADLNKARTIGEPNVQVESELLNADTNFGGNITTIEYKNIEGVVVPWRTLTSHYTPFGRALDQRLEHGIEGVVTRSHQTFQAQSGQKVARFFSPKAPNLPNELAQLPDDPKQVAEVALTFTKPLTLKALKAHLPQGVHPQWGYVLTVATEKPMPTVKVQGLALTPEPTALDYWQEALKARWVGEATADYRAALQAKPGTLRLKGVIVTGANPALKALQGSDWLAATSVGVTATKSAVVK